MSSSGHRHLLLLYMYTINRWWRKVLGAGIVLLGLSLGLGLLPRYLPQDHFLSVDPRKLWAAGGLAVLLIAVSVFLVAIRKSAYVQPFSDHLRVVTPFLRLHIAYRRIQQAASGEMSALFPPSKVRGWRRSFLGPLLGKTVVVLDLAAIPISRTALRLFLSPYFFPDKSPRLILLVPDWMAFSTELESARSAWLESQRRQPGDSYGSIFVTPERKP